MLLFERDPLVITDWSRDVATTERPGGVIVAPHAPRRAILLLWVVVVALMHFDRGVITVAAMQVLKSDDFASVAALLAWHSLGLASGNAIAGAVFQQASAKLIIVLALFLDAVTLLVLGVLEVGIVGIAALRFISGFAASLPLVFLPLWVDEYSPSEGGAQWIALVQMGAPVGQFFGIVVASVVTLVVGSSSGASWHVAMFVQALLLTPVLLRLGFVSADKVDVSNISSLRTRLDSLTLYPVEGNQIGYVNAILREMREMLAGVSRNPLTTSLTSALCLVQATSTGLMLWVAPYLSRSTGAPTELITLLIVATSFLVLPMVGTYVGALLCDRMEGFKAGHHAAALRVAVVFLVTASLAAPMSGCMSNFAMRLGLLWLWLFSAGAFLPVSAGVLMTSMPSYLRSFSSASSLLLVHVMSFAIVPAASAMLMGCFGAAPQGLNFGVSFSFWMTVPAAVLLFLAYMREPKCASPTGLSGVDDLTFSDISYELSRRRMSTAPL